jgi:hypothetical protein
MVCVNIENKLSAKPFFLIHIPGDRNSVKGSRMIDTMRSDRSQVSYKLIFVQIAYMSPPSGSLNITGTALWAFFNR